LKMKAQRVGCADPAISSIPERRRSTRWRARNA
jgi:hypothetical protein